MLILCPECQLQVSDKAMVCPHCGYPLSPEAKKQRQPRKSHRKRLPNGFGQISEIKGKGLRKPFRAMVTVGKTETGRPICKLLKPEAYFETYNDAYTALVKFNQNPYDFSNDITMDELFNRWLEKHSKHLKSKESVRNIVYAWKHCSPIHQMDVKLVRARHLRETIECQALSAYNQHVVKQILNQMFDYAVEYEIVEHNYARDLKLKIESDAAAEAHHTISNEEMDILWSHVGESMWIDMILIQCYSGWRPIELCLLRKENIDLSIGSMTGGAKTNYGRNRQIPIHSKILSLVEKYYKETESEFLFGKVTYGHFRECFVRETERIGLSRHTPHDCRVRFVTVAKESELSEYAIKRIVGHSIADLTERVYTKRDFGWLKTEIEKIK